MTTTDKHRTRLPADTWQVVSLGYGETLRLTDLTGGACCQVIPVNRGDRRERFSAPNTMLMNKHVYFTSGSMLYSYFCNPMLEVTETTTTHDALPGRLPEGDDVLRLDLLAAAFEPIGLARHQVPYPFLAFVRHVIAVDGSVGHARSVSTAGDTVCLRAELDVDVVLANTPSLLEDAGDDCVVEVETLPEEAR